MCRCTCNRANFHDQSCDQVHGPHDSEQIITIQSSSNWGKIQNLMFKCSFDRDLLASPSLPKINLDNIHHFKGNTKLNLGALCGIKHREEEEEHTLQCLTHTYNVQGNFSYGQQMDSATANFMSLSCACKFPWAVVCQVWHNKISVAFVEHRLHLVVSM